MTGDGVRLDRTESIATITVDRPAARNALTVAMKGQLIDMCAELGADRDIRVVAIRGAGGKSFISGADIKEMGEIGVDGFVEQVRLVEELYAAIESIPQPTVAVIEGYALGSGLFLALACDMRVCTVDSKLGAPAAALLGNCLAPGEYSRLVDALGPLRTKELLMRARVLTAEHALSWGLVSDVVERADLDAHVAELLATLAGHAPLAMWAAKEAVRRVASPEPAALDDILTVVFGSDDFKEGRAAFNEKRPPHWRNS